MEYPDKEGVTLKCTRKQETPERHQAAYLDRHGVSSIYKDLSTYAKRVPIHLAYGAIDDYVPGDVKEDVVNNALGGVKNLASFSRVANAGHLAVQTNPPGVARAVYEVLTGVRCASGKL
ncbi:hypothetical protein VNI00_015988 [Paramarasmius palmivorus]|uniref:Uncharacterized protein n=1 Tax=Paramarasmius palmivorus TaxID=297713 RepID=A0AAW0BGC1_9AGAR